MSLQLINDLYKEIRRLSIAGAELSRADFRLKNVLNDLAKIKDSSAVLQRLYTTGMKVIESDNAEVNQNFLELSNLVSAVMVTQADTQTAGEITSLHNFPLGSPSQVSYRRLYPVIEALTGSGAGRTKIITEYYSSGLAVDMRLIGPLIGALGGYQEIADISLELLKKADSRILPLIKESFHIKGHKGDARKLVLIYHFAKDTERDLYIQAMNDGFKEVRESAIEILEQSKEGSKIVKEYKQQMKKSEENEKNSPGGIFSLKKLFKK
jgi:hypothetical protein